MKKVHLLMLLFMTLSLINGSVIAANLHHHQPAASQQATQQQALPMINLNTATIAELKTLRGIGLKKAAAIVAYREQHGPFTSVNDLTKVKGISQRMVDIIKVRLQLAKNKQ